MVFYPYFPNEKRDIQSTPLLTETHDRWPRAIAETSSDKAAANARSWTIAIPYYNRCLPSLLASFLPTSKLFFCGVQAFIVVMNSVPTFVITALLL